MRRGLKTSTLSVLLLSALLSACGTTRGSLPAPAVQIPVGQRLRDPGCLGLAPPAPDTMPAGADEAMATRFLAARELPAEDTQTLALMAAFALAVQIAERAYWGEREPVHAEVAAQSCLDRQQLVATIDAANAANAEAARQ